MSDPANPLKTYHQRQIDDQATPVRLYGPDGGSPTVQLSGSSPVEEASEAVAVSSTAVGLTTVPATANGALVTVEGSEVRFWVDGSTPTAAAGHLAGPGDTIELTTRDEVLGFSAIRVSDDAALQVTYLVGAP